MLRRGDPNESPRARFDEAGLPNKFQAALLIIRQLFRVRDSRQTKNFSGSRAIKTPRTFRHGAYLYCDCAVMPLSYKTIGFLVGEYDARAERARLLDVHKSVRYYDDHIAHGLGLILVGQILQAHQGSMGMQNITPHGLKVSLYLPLEKR